MPQRKSYHTSLKIAIATGHTFQLPDDLIREIPSSTISDWKNTDPKKFIGCEYAEVIHQNLKQTQVFHHPSMILEKQLLLIVASIKFFLHDLFTEDGFTKVLRENMTKTVNFVERFEKRINIKDASRLLGIPKDTFYRWRSRIKFSCDASALLSCTKRNPNQASKRELLVVKSFLGDPKFENWGIANVWGYAFRYGHTSLSKHSWYRYNSLFNFRDTKRSRKIRKYKPLIAKRINQYWHMDITRIVTLDGEVHYYYALMDNYSRKILAWFLHHRVEGKVTALLIKKACLRAFGNTMPDQTVKLISDEGTENTSLAVREFIENTKYNIQHLIARKDIVQSNSMVEAIFRGTKSGYLDYKELNTGKVLFRELCLRDCEYNQVKPHSRHLIYTPNEVYHGKNLITDFKQIYAQAAEDRRDYNRNNGCGKCDE